MRTVRLAPWRPLQRSARARSSADLRLLLAAPGLHLSVDAHAVRVVCGMRSDEHNGLPETGETHRTLGARPASRTATSP